MSVGIDHDTAEFAVETLGRWWEEMGLALYPKATRQLITADGGGRNGSRVRRWKAALLHRGGLANCVPKPGSGTSLQRSSPPAPGEERGRGKEIAPAGNNFLPYRYRNRYPPSC